MNVLKPTMGMIESVRVLDRFFEPLAKGVRSQIDPTPVRAEVTHGPPGRLHHFC